jgi:putative membrane protein
MKLSCSLFSSFCLLVSLSFTAHCFAVESGLSPAGKLFIKDAASINLMEIQLGRVAQDKGVTQDVKDYGESMVLDHSEANEELQDIASQKNLKLPTQVERKHTQMIARLSKLSGTRFDRRYLQAMVENHQKSIGRFKKAIRKVRDPDLKAWSVAMLPVLEHHLLEAKEITRKLGHL